MFFEAETIDSIFYVSHHDNYMYIYMEYPHLNTGLYGLYIYIYVDYQPLLSGMPV